MRKLGVMLAVAVLGLVAVTVLAQSSRTGGVRNNPATRSATRDTTGDHAAQIASLLAMEPTQRRAALKAMTPEERRELLSALQQAKRAKRGERPDPPAHGITPHRLTDEQKAERSPVMGAPGVEALAGLPGFIRYDSGTATLTYFDTGLVGNRFDTHEGDPLAATGTINTVMAYLELGPLASTPAPAVLAINGPQTPGGGALNIFTALTIGTGPTFVFTGLGVNYTGGSFFVFFSNSPSNYIPALVTGTTLGQGHHARLGSVGGGPFDVTRTFTLSNSFNAIIRVAGNVLVPVELMRFGVE